VPALVSLRECPTQILKEKRPTSCTLPKIETLPRPAPSISCASSLDIFDRREKNTSTSSDYKFRQKNLKSKKMYATVSFCKNIASADVKKVKKLHLDLGRKLLLLHPDLEKHTNFDIIDVEKGKTKKSYM
jgi:hypothetical protein